MKNRLVALLLVLAMLAGLSVSVFAADGPSLQALVIEAQGGEGEIVLNWLQTDFDAIAGYNVYKSITKTKGFEKINDEVIADTTYTDTNVEVGTTYYYYVKIVNTSGIEENASDTVSAKPVDTTAPEIQHTKVTTAKAGTGVTLSVVATDNNALYSIKAFYRITGTAEYTAVTMTAGADNTYSAKIDKDYVTPAGVDYYFSAEDYDSNVAYFGTALQPNHIAISGDPYIAGLMPASVGIAGGSTVKIYGGNFTETGMTVKVDGVALDGYTYENSGLISFVAPAKNVGSYTVTVTNAEAVTVASPVLLAYNDASNTVQLPTNVQMTPDTQYTLPLYVSMAGTLYNFEAKIEIPEAAYATAAVEKPEGAPTFFLESNYENGVLTIVCASTAEIRQSADIPVLNIVVTTQSAIAEATPANLTLKNVKCNGSKTAKLINCKAVVSPTFSLDVAATYFGSTKAVEGITVAADGIQQTTDAQGEATLDNLPNATVTVVATKEGYVADDVVLAADASLILKYLAGTETLTDYQKIAADVDGNGTIEAQDATLILQFAVGNATSFPAGAWKIVTANATKTITAEDHAMAFTAILVGDVDGSWAADPE